MSNRTQIVCLHEGKAGRSVDPVFINRLMRSLKPAWIRPWGGSNTVRLEGCGGRKAVMEAVPKRLKEVLAAGGHSTLMVWENLPARLFQTGARPELRSAGALFQEPTHGHAAGALPSRGHRHARHGHGPKRCASRHLRVEEPRDRPKLASGGATISRRPRSGSAPIPVQEMRPGAFRRRSG